MTNLGRPSIALIKKDQSSDWVSCQSITRNLIHAYEQTPGIEVTVFSLCHSANNYQCLELIEQLAQLKVDVICWVDHYPHPGNFIKTLDGFLEMSDYSDWRPKFNFHLFGDFSLHAPLWLDCEKALKKFAVNFICASQAQKGFVDQFLINNESSIIPFPCNEEVFYFSEFERAAQRKVWGVSDNTPVLIYSGRISRQKNVLELLDSFQQVIPHLDPRPELFICGDFDDLNIPFIGLHSDFGHYFQTLIHHQKKSSFFDNIHMVGQLGHDDLRKAYNASDLFISLSTHNDEDYGMCPAEAALCGLPLVLSGWGGYHSFASMLKKQVSLLEVNYQQRRILPDLLSLKKKLMCFEVQQDGPLRSEYSQRAQHKIGIKAVSEQLKELYTQRASKFDGFTHHFEKFASGILMSPKAPFRDGQGDYNRSFRQAYGQYFKPGSVHE